MSDQLPLDPIYNHFQLESSFKMLKANQLIEEGIGPEELLNNGSSFIDKKRLLDYILTEKRQGLLGFTLVNLSMLFHCINETSTSNEVKFKSKQLKRICDEKIVELVSPLILKFFFWDIERRNWADHQKSDKVKFLRELSLQLQSELEGSYSHITHKYFTLLLERVKGLFTNLDQNSIEELEKTNDKLGYKFTIYDMINSLDEIIENARKSDNDVISQIDDVYGIIAKEFRSGLIKSDGRFHFFLRSFVNAQSMFKEIIINQIDILENSISIGESKIHQLLLENRFIEFSDEIKSLFASVPNQLVKNTNEAYYHIFIHLILKLSGCKIESEVSTNLGRIDAVIETINAINIVEFKMDGQGDPLEQIRAKKYFQRYLNSHKRINLIGMSFDKVDRNVKNLIVVEDFHNHQQWGDK
ncbi:MAG: PD-(D/E)XK nuclease domain-containing protein [Bacteroidia bacterium]|nr:PD-(D/E)XK nuclease domain-containing protein [Bacteroidia bacterium]